MDAVDAAIADAGAALLDLYPTAVGEVYGYHLHRCRNAVVAEDLTADTFMSAVASIRRNVVDDVTVAWLIGIARHKLLDHWRRLERERRNLAAISGAGAAAGFGAVGGVAADAVSGASGASGEETVDEASSSNDGGWDVRLDAMAARDVLDRLGAHHRSVLTLRYVDDLPVADVAAVMERTVHATEALLVRARRAFRDLYDQQEATG